MEPTADLATILPAGAVQKYDMNDFNKVAGSTSWLPRLQLMAAGSGLVVSDKIRAGAYALIHDADKFTDLTNTVECIPLGWRPKAMDTSGGEMISVYKIDHPEFKRIQDQSEVKDSGCFYGPEFLLYIPNHGFCTFLMGSKTMRNEAPALSDLLTTRKAATLKSKLIDPPKSKYKWWGPVITACSSPFSVLPTAEEVNEQLEKFMNPKETELEAADNAGPARER